MDSDHLRHLAECLKAKYDEADAYHKWLVADDGAELAEAVLAYFEERNK
jgi:hypothetical protein